MKSNKKLSFVTEKNEYLDGKIQNAQTIVESTYVATEPDYVKIYLDNVLILKNVPQSRNPILYEMLKLMTYAQEKQLIALTSYIKKEIAKSAKVSLDYVNKAITEFTKASILIRVGVGTYQVNPMIFGKGKWEDIQKLRLEMKYKDSTTGQEEKIDFKNIASNGEVAVTKEIERAV